MAALPKGIEVYTIDKWLGLRENPDGEWGNLPGEAIRMENFRITSDGSLKTRPGTKTLWNVGPGAVKGLWSGYVKGKKELVCAVGGRIKRLLPDGVAEDLGQSENAKTYFFGFGGLLYMLNGQSYKVWDGQSEVCDVEGYAPLIAVSTPPEGGGVDYERINLLTSLKRQSFSPTGTREQGTSTVFKLREENIDAVERVTVDGAELDEGWTADLEAGTVTFDTAPPGGVPDSVEICWRKGEALAEEILKCRFAALFGGKNDTRVFFYGNGTNTVYHSAINQHGVPDPTYFTATGFMRVDTENTPVTGLCRQYDRLLIFKEDSSYRCSFDLMTDEGGGVLPAFFISPLNGAVGNAAAGQALLIENNPVTLFAGGLWEFVSNQVRDERNAREISGRVSKSLRGMDLSRAVTYDDERRKELWIASDGRIIIYNYGQDCFYAYSGINPLVFAEWQGEVVFGTADGKIKMLSKDFRNDDGEPIRAVWESAPMGFGAENVRKYLSWVWATLEPESEGRAYIRVETNRRGDYLRKLVACGISSFEHLQFGHMSFITNRKPQPNRISLRVKRFNNLKIIIENDSESVSSPATVLNLGFGLRRSRGIRI